MKITQEQLETLISDAVATNVEKMGTKVTEDIKQQIGIEVKSLLTDDKDVRKFLVPDTTQEDLGNDPKAGFKSFSDFAISVKKAEVSQGRNTDERLIKMIEGEKEEKAASTTSVNETDSEYGDFLIPEEYRNQLLEIAIKKSNILSMTMAIPMATNALNIPYVQGETRSGGLTHGGIKFNWVDEENSITETRPKFGKIALRLNKCAGLVYASDEIIEDSPISLEPMLTRMFGESFAWTLDNIFINGSGAGQPLGIKNAPCLISVAIETDQPDTTIVYENILKMYARMWDKSKMVWMANDDTFTQLASMSLAVGTGGIPVYLPAGGASGKPYDTLMGKPLMFTEHCATLGGVGDIYAADWSQYLVGQKNGGSLQFASSIHLKFDAAQTAFRFIFRIDGQPWWAKAVTPRYSSDTLSPFTSIAARP